MDTSDGENSEGPLSIWKAYNSLVVTLFKDLNQACTGLESIMTSIINMQGNIQEFLVPKISTPDSLKVQYQAFNKWLLSRIFFILTNKRFATIHDKSVQVQIQILSTLHSCGASFFIEIFQDYSTALEEIVQFYESTNEDNMSVILNILIPEDVETVLDLSSVTLKVNNKNIAANLIQCLLKILVEIHLYTKSFVLCSDINKRILKNVLKVFENFDLKLKVAAMKFFTNIIEHSGICTFDSSIFSFLNMTEMFLQNLHLVIDVDKQENEIKDINTHLKIVFDKCCHEDIAKDYKNVISNMAEHILCSYVNESAEFVFKYSENLVNSCKQLLEKLIYDDKNSSLLDCSSNFDKIAKILPSFYLQKFLLEIYENPDENTVSLYKNCASFKMFYGKIQESLNIISENSVNSLVFSAHLAQISNMLTILFNFKIYFHIRRKKMDAQVKKITDSNLKILSNDISHMFLENLITAFKSNINKCNQPFRDIAMTINMFTKLLYITHDINISDVLAILDFESYPFCIGDSSNWLSTFLSNSGQQYDISKEQISVFKVLLSQQLILPKSSYITRFKQKCVDILKLCADSTDDFMKLEIIKISPLLLLNNAITPEELITNHLYPAYVSKDNRMLYELVQILPVIVCITSQTYSLRQTSHMMKKSFGHQLNLPNGIFVYLLCKNCHEIEEHNIVNDGSIEVINDSSLKYSACNINRLKLILKEFLLLDKFTNISHKDLSKFLLGFSKHSILSMSCLEFLMKNNSTELLIDILEPFLSGLLNDSNIEESLKTEILNTITLYTLKLCKTSLESGNERQQENCLECVRQFGRSRHPLAILPSLKISVGFVMNHSSVYVAKAALHIRDICQAHGTTPVEVYHKYKKDFCRIMMEFLAYNYLVDQENSMWSIVRIVQVFGFAGLRDFVSKDMRHALPYLIPLIVKSEKLKGIVNQMAQMTNSTVAEFVSERFPYMYTHIYITENERNVKKCYNYIEEVTGLQITVLIKKHFRIILTEFLLQYCCEPEKVLQACRWLAKNDPEYTPKQSDSTLTLSQVADFIQPRFLGVLAYIDSKLVNAKVAMSVKRKALQSFPYILNLMGNQHMTPLRFKILATLRTALSLISEYPLLNAAAWNAFIHNIDTGVLGPLLSSIFVSLLPLLEKAEKETNEIFEYLVISNETLLSLYIPDLFFMTDKNISTNVLQIISKHFQRVYPQQFIAKIRWLLKYLNHDSSEIRVHTFKHLLKLIKDSQIDINNAMFGSKDVDRTIIDLIDILIAGCRDKDAKVSEYSGRCLGSFGAVEPSLLPRHFTSQAATESPTTFAFFISDRNFIKQALVELTKAFHTEKHTKNMDCYALAIQEMLKTYNIAPDGQNKQLWQSFSDSMHQIMLPLLSSRYILSDLSNTKHIHPVYGSNQAATFNEWTFNWTSQLITHIDSGPTQDVLKNVLPSLRRDLSTLVLFLPYVVLHAILSSNNDKNIAEEMIAVVGAESFNHDHEVSSGISKYKTFVSLNFTPSITPLVHEEGTHLKCRKMVYLLFDFLNRWLLEWTHQKQNAHKDENFKKIDTFLNSFCKLTVARGNFLCGELERALQYLEMYVEGSQVRLHEQLAFLAEIYAVLNEPDCVAGIMRMKQSEPSLRELVLAHKVTGQLQDAATCYEKSAQEGELDDETLQGMVEVYLGLDQPYTALSLLQGANIRAKGGLAAEPMWRLGRFQDLDALLKEPDVCDDRQWGVRVGHCLLALRNGERDTLEERLCSARESLLRRLGETTSSTSEIRRGYSHSYHNALGLHMLDEIEHSEELIYRIKDHPDQSHECMSIIEKLIEEWDLRLSLVQASSTTVEPVLRLRRILLEQAKDLLSPTHPQTTASLNSHIGKIWLQSAKFARKASIFQQAYIYILNAEKYSPKELFIEKAKLYWERGQQEPAFYTLNRGLEEHFSSISQLPVSERKICARAKLLLARYNDETSNVDMDVNIVHYKEAMEAHRQWEKSLVYLAEYYEKMYNALSPEMKHQSVGSSARAQALNCYGKAMQYGHTKLYQSMPRMLSIWLDFEVQSSDPKSQSMITLKQICSIIDTFSKRLPKYLFLTAFSQIISRVCHPIKEVYDQLKSIIIDLILEYPQHSLWMMMCVIKSSYPQRLKRCQDILGDPRLKQQPMVKFIYDFNQLAEKLIELCNKPIAPKVQNTQVSTLVRSLPKLLASDNFSSIMMPHQQFVKVVLPFNCKGMDTSYNPFPHMVYIAGIEEAVTVFPSLQRPRKITFIGSNGKKYHVMLKPKDDLRKDFRLMEFNGVVNRYLQENAEARERRLYIRTYTVLPLNEECGILEWIDNLTGLRPILVQLYKMKGIFTTPKELKELMCNVSDPLSKKRQVFETKLLPKHPPLFDIWFRHTFPDPHTWYQARSAYIRTTAVMSMVGYILGLGDRHGENILFDSKSGDTVHVDFNCLFNKGESFEWPERVPFRLTHNMTHAMGPLGCEGTYRKCCEVTLRVLKSQTSTLMSVIRPFVYDPLVAWQKNASKDTSTAERTNQLAKDHLIHIKQRLQGMVMTKDKQFSLSLSPEGQANNLILEATSVNNLCQMYIGWGPFM